MEKNIILMDLVEIYANIQKTYESGIIRFEILEHKEKLNGWQEEHYKKFTDNKELKGFIDTILECSKQDIETLKEMNEEGDDE